MTTYGYLRVSTEQQDHDAQRLALEPHGIDRWHVDTISGAKTSRPALDAMLEELRRGDRLVVFKLDRLGRSMQHLVNLVLDLEARGITVHSHSESLDTATPVGKMILAVYAGMAELERENIRTRTRAGMAAAKARGADIGNVEHIGAAGAERGRTAQRERALEQAEQLRWAVEPLVAEGLSKAQIAEILNKRGVAHPAGSKWTRKSVAKVVRRLAA